MPSTPAKDELIELKEYDEFCDSSYIRWVQMTNKGDFLDAAFQDFEFSSQNTGVQTGTVAGLTGGSRTSTSSIFSFLRPRKR
jgi:hypothetical protein